MEVSTPSPASQTPADLKDRVRLYYQRLVLSERTWIRQLLDLLTGVTVPTDAVSHHVSVDMARLLTVATSCVYYLILADAPPAIVAPINSHVGRMVTHQAAAPISTDLVFLCWLILRSNVCSHSSSDDDSMPDDVKRMYM